MLPLPGPEHGFAGSTPALGTKIASFSPKECHASGSGHPGKKRPTNSRESATERPGVACKALQKLPGKGPPPRWRPRPLSVRMWRNW